MNIDLHKLTNQLGYTIDVDDEEGVIRIFGNKDELVHKFIKEYSERLDLDGAESDFFVSSLYNLLAKINFLRCMK